MSCSQVMYQPYASYLPYDRTADEKKYHHLHGSSSPEGHYQLHSRSPYPSGSVPGDPVASGSRVPTAASSPMPGPSSVIVPHRPSPAHSKAPQAEIDPDPEECHKEAQYLSSNCVIYIHYRGDAASIVDEHFHRALSQDSYNPADGKTNPTKNTPSMSERLFPASFWNSDYQPPRSHPHQVSYANSHSELFSQAEAYHAHAVASLHNHHAHLAAHAHHQAGDHWHYPLNPQAYAHHNLPSTYPGVSAAAARFNQQYGPLFFHQSGHPARITSAAATSASATVKTEPWASRYPEALGFASELSHGTVDPAANYSGHSSYSNVSGLETGQLGEPAAPAAKDLYWF